MCIEELSFKNITAVLPGNHEHMMSYTFGDEDKTITQDNIQQPRGNEPMSFEQATCKKSCFIHSANEHVMNACCVLALSHV